MAFYFVRSFVTPLVHSVAAMSRSIRPQSTRSTLQQQSRTHKSQFTLKALSLGVARQILGVKICYTYVA